MLQCHNFLYHPLYDLLYHVLCYLRYRQYAECCISEAWPGHRLIILLVLIAKVCTVSILQSHQIVLRSSSMLPHSPLVRI
jgi:hypothetical protein